MSNNDSEVTVEVRERSGCLSILIRIVVCYFVYRAIEAWLPKIYSAIEIYSYSKLNDIWYILLAITIICTMVYTIFKTFAINKFTIFLKSLFDILAKAASMILCVWLIFNVAGLGNIHYITKLVMDSEVIGADDINEESNGKWVLKVQEKINDKRLEKESNPTDKETLFDTIYSFISKEIDEAPELIGAILQFFLMIFAILILVVILFLWFFIDISPLILVPVLGLILVFLLNVIIGLILSPIKERILMQQILSNPTAENTHMSEKISQMLGEKKEYHEDTAQTAGMSIKIQPIHNETELNAHLDHMANPEQHPDPFE